MHIGGFRLTSVLLQTTLFIIWVCWKCAWHLKSLDMLQCIDTIWISDEIEKDEIA